MSAFKDPNDRDPDQMKKLAATVLMFVFLLWFVLSDMMKIKPVENIKEESEWTFKN